MPSPRSWPAPDAARRSPRAWQAGALLHGEFRGWRDEAEKFLKEIPVPDPSFFDLKSDIAQLLGLPRNFPITTFYDRRGEKIYTKPGGYASEAALADDVREYAIAAARKGAGG